MSNAFRRSSNKSLGKARGRVEKLATHHRGKARPSHHTHKDRNSTETFHPIYRNSVPLATATSNTEEVDKLKTIIHEHTRQTNRSKEQNLPNHIDDRSDDEESSFATLNGAVDEDPIELLELSFGRGRKKTKITYDGQNVPLTDSLHIIPTLKLSSKSHDPEKYYTILMVDPDSPDPSNPQHGEYIHWLLLNVKSNTNEITSLADKKLSYRNEKHKRHKYSKQSDKDNIDDSIYHLVPYESPNPLIGKHRIVTLIYEQSGIIRHPPKNVVMKDDGLTPLRTKFNTIRFINEHRKLQTGKLIAGNYFYIEATNSSSNQSYGHSEKGMEEKEKLLKRGIYGKNYQVRQEVLKRLREEYGKYTRLEEERENIMHMKQLGIEQRLNALIDSIDKEGDVHLENDNDNNDIDQNSENIENNEIFDEQSFENDGEKDKEN